MRFARFAAPLALCLAFPATAQDDPVSPIRLNQLGFETAGPKRAMLANAATDPLDWALTDAAGGVVQRGRTTVFGADAASGESVHAIDFGGFARAGKGYRLHVGAMASRPFTIGAGTRGHLARDALAYFYHSRAGVPIEARYVGARWARSAGHVHEVAGCISGKDARGTVWPGCSYALDVTGGWYDAGDQGKYVVNGGIALWTLLNAYEREHLAGRAGSFADGRMPIPEAGNHVDDLLDEARYEMAFLLEMQVPEGMRLTVAVGPPPRFGPPVPGAPPPAPLNMVEIDASGMAHHKVADRNWTRLPTPPALDTEERVIFPPSTGATLNLAATAAQCARIWRSIDPAFSARCLAAAERAWAAAARNPQVFPVAAFGGSGGYGDNDYSDESYWAAAELFATTGKPEYLAAVRASPHFAEDLAEPSWGRTATLGTITLATAANALPLADVGRLRSAIVAAADRFLADEGRTGYHVPYAPPGYPWGSTSSLLNRAMLLGYARDFTGEARYRDGVVDAIDYLLGRNPLDKSFISGYGARPLMNPHHRFWAHSIDPNLPGPPPGVISGGPNSTFMSDPVAARLKGKCAPMTCYADETFAFSVNEVAINWNAPLVWVAAWLDE
ncbi:MAG: glycoside hydrolase family 9 protein [Sphingomonas sp.]